MLPLGGLNPLSTNPTKWLYTPKHIVIKLPTNCLSVFDHFVGLELKGLKQSRLLEVRAIFDFLTLHCVK